MSRRDAIQAQLDALPVPVQSSVLDLETVAALLEDSRLLWDGASDLERKMWLNVMFERLYLQEGYIRAVEPAPVMALLLQINGNPESLSIEHGRTVLIVQPGTPFQEVQTHLGISTE